MTETYKNIKFNTEQRSITITLLEEQVQKDNEYINFYHEKLNGAGSTKDVREWTDYIREFKNRINSVNEIIKQLKHNEYIIKHTL
jgi:hypothetical protein